MRRIIIGVLISMLVLSSGMGAFSAATTQKKSVENEPINNSYSHTIFAEYFTMTTCVPCKYSHQALFQLYYEKGGWHPFYYITYVYNKNNNSRDRKLQLGVVGSPTTKFDGGYKTVTGGSDIETEKTRFNNSILLCGARDVDDIDLTLNVEWLGAVNNHPEDGETGVPIEVKLNWTISEMKIDVWVKNNEAIEFDKHLHVQVTEVNSTWWDDKFGKPYTFEFKDYAIDETINLSAGENWSKTVYWDGFDYDDRDKIPRNFGHINQDNIMVIGAVFANTSKAYVDETAGFLAGENCDPKYFDVYFGDTNPPPQITSNQTSMQFNPYPDLNWTTDYYWKVDVWNNKGERTPGKVWKFTTRGNTAPFKPLDVYPQNQSKDIPIDVILKWKGGDPENDKVTYDVYFGVHDPMNPPPLIEKDIEDEFYDPSPIGNLDFSTRYDWKIVAWDKYGEKTEGDIWHFTTEDNVPPNPAKDPIPPNNAKNVPVNATLYWNGTDPNSGDELEYDVYFGKTTNPPKVKTLTEEEYDPPNDMDLYQDYFWRIVTRDREGLETSGPEWKFRTGINEPPTDPEIDGPDRGNPGIEYSFTFVSTDPINQSIKYIVDWDDGEITETDFNKSGEVVTLNHTWERQKRTPYVIKATAVDEFEKASLNVSQHPILIPRNRAVSYNFNILSWLFERFPHMFQLLKFLLGL